MKVRTELWTDGSGTAAGPIGWAFVLRAIDLDSGQVLAEQEGSGSFPEGTNNRAELAAVIEGLLTLNRAATVVVFTDSEYVANPFRKGWLAKWESNGWRTAQASQGLRPEAACPTCGAGGEPGEDCARHDPPTAMRTDYDRRAVRNRDLWQQLATAAKLHRLTFEHVKGHAGNALNERCDELAGAARRALLERLATAPAATV